MWNEWLCICLLGVSEHYGWRIVAGCDVSMFDAVGPTRGHVVNVLILAVFSNSDFAFSAVSCMKPQRSTQIVFTLPRLGISTRGRCDVEIRNPLRAQ